MGQYSPEFAVGVQEQATIDTALDTCHKLCSPRLGISMSVHGPTLTCNDAVRSLLLEQFRHCSTVDNGSNQIIRNVVIAAPAGSRCAQPRLHFNSTR
jgi:hypothetical protein